MAFIAPRIQDVPLCPVCGFLFDTIPILTEHFKISHLINGQNFCFEGACLHRPLTFLCTTDLIRHTISVHTNLRPYICPAPNCGKEFSIKAGLKSHMMRPHPVAAVERSFSCMYCGKAYAYKKCLKEHARKEHPETVERDYCCGYCDEEYHNIEELHKHLDASHPVVEKTHACSFCGGGFETKDELQQHLWDLHRGCIQ